MKEFYFTKFENRKPYGPVPYSPRREFIFQYLATINIALGVWYFYWRWGYSLNMNALWFAIPLAAAETLAFLSTSLFILNLWAYKDPKQFPPRVTVNETLRDEDKLQKDRPISVDIFLPTYSEDPELVRYSIVDAKKITYPHPIDIRIYVLDDGRRDEMKKIAEEEGVFYLTRPNNVGFKAGNLKNAIDHTSGDFLVILDADTRPFPTFLEQTMGYFRDPDVAWVQTPQWFYDIVEGTRLNIYLKEKIGTIGYWVGTVVEKLVGKVFVNQDLFGNDPKMFYDCILRKRMAYNTSFCCGAGSVHRREAVVRGALIRYAKGIEQHVNEMSTNVETPELEEDLKFGLQRGYMQEKEITPYIYHLSEDIYTSMLLHADESHNWKSIYHPWIQSKMLSPQDILSWQIQRFRYAGGTLDLLRRDNPLFKPGLSLGQKIMYFSSGYSYFAALWMVIFLLTPPVFFFTGIVPVSGLDLDFFTHILTFQIISQITFIVGTWGVNTLRDVQYYVAFFPVNLKAIWTVLKGKTIKFKVTPKTGEKRTYLNLVRPQLGMIFLNVAGIGYYLGRILLGYPSDLLGFIVATFWSIVNMNSLMVMIRASLWQGEDVSI